MAGHQVGTGDDLDYELVGHAQASPSVSVGLRSAADGRGGVVLVTAGVTLPRCAPAVRWRPDRPELRW